MTKIIATGLAILLQFIYPIRGHNHNVVSTGINGTFFCTKHPTHLAGLVFWDGKMWGQFPSKETHRRGGLICYKDGTVEAGYFEVNKKAKSNPPVPGGNLLFNGKPVNWKDVKWAITGGGLFLIDGKPLTAREVSKKENLSSYITTHSSYSFILVHKDRKRVSLGVSKRGIPPASLARKWKENAYALLRLDGGSQTAYWIGRKPPKYVNNGVGWLMPSPSSNLKQDQKGNPQGILQPNQNHQAPSAKGSD